MKRFFIAVIQVIGYFLAIFLFIALAVILTKLIFGSLDYDEPRLAILLLGVQIVFAVAVVGALMRWIGKSQLARSGWLGLRSSMRWFGIGTLVGLLICGGMLIITLVSGGGSFNFDTDGLSQYFEYVLPLVFFLLILALGEEWIFRGYPLTKLSRVVGRGWANVIVSLFFMAGHWGGSGWNILVAINIFLFSLVNGAMRFTPGGIPAAWGFHFAWNGLHVLLGATLTGENFGVPVVRFISQGPVWLSGGAYGPEGGLGTTMATIVGLILIWRFMGRRVTVSGAAH
jgi:membrane protease YdiL (CAAX protease family)